MQKTWYFMEWNQRRLTNAFQLALAAAFVFACPRASAGTPDWMKQVAQAQLPAYPADTDAVVLLDERLTSISPPGEVRVTYRKAYRILRPQARTLGTVYVYFDSETQLKFLKGWSITSRNEEYEVKESDAVETSAFSESLYADTRYKLLQIPASQPGSVIGYEYQQRQRPSVLQAVWSFQDQIPVHRARFVLELPQNWSYTAHWRNHVVVNPQQAGENRWTWELADIEPIKLEPQMPTWRSVAGQLGISFASNAQAGPESGHGSWAQIGRWYAQLTSDRREITPQIRDKTSDLLAGTNDPLEKIRRLASYVQRSIRYVAIEIGIGGFQPHSAHEVLVNGYGDCKDKATLLSAMLREAGIDSYYLLINDAREYVAPDFPSPVGFNHAILAIHLPQQAIAELFATLSHPRLGLLLLFDPTESSTPLGYLPPTLQSNHALLVTDGDGELVRLPLLSPTTNRLLRIATLTLDKSGNLQGTVEEVRTGPAATSLKELLLRLPNSQRQKVFENLLADLLNGAVLTSAGTSDLKDFSGWLSIKYGLIARAYAQHEGELFLFRSCVLGRKSSDVLEGEPRKHAVVFSHSALESDAFDISFPAEYAVDELPQHVEYKYPFATYKSEFRAAEHVLHYTRTYELKDIRVPLEQLDDLKTLFRHIADDERAYTILKSQPSTSSLAPRPLLPQAPF
jgi:predicted transglutaminase-like cysteine proteinase